MMNFKQFENVPSDIKDQFYTFALSEICSDFDRVVKPATIIEIIASGMYSELYTICEAYEGNSGKTLASIIESLAESQYYNVTRMVATEDIYRCLERGHYVRVNTLTADMFTEWDNTLTIDGCDVIAGIVFAETDEIDEIDIMRAIDEYMDLYLEDIK